MCLCFSVIAFIAHKVTKDVYLTLHLSRNANVVASFKRLVYLNYHPKAAVMIWWSHELMPTIPTVVLAMRTIVFTIIIVMMMIAATVALFRSPLTITTLVSKVLFILPHGFMSLLSRLSLRLSGRRLPLLHTLSNRYTTKRDIVGAGVRRRNCASSKNCLPKLLFQQLS